MPLPYIITSPPGEGGFDNFVFMNYNDHLEIIQKLFQLNIANLPTYDIITVNQDDFQSWLERHQQYHNDANGVLRLGGTDLTTVDFNDDGQRKAWFWLHFLEHQQMHEALKI